MNSWAVAADPRRQDFRVLILVTNTPGGPVNVNSENPFTWMVRRTQSCMGSTGAAIARSFVKNSRPTISTSSRSMSRKMARRKPWKNMATRQPVGGLHPRQWNRPQGRQCGAEELPSRAARIIPSATLIPRPVKRCMFQGIFLQGALAYVVDRRCCFQVGENEYFTRS